MITREVTADELIELCADEAWQILRFSRTADGGYRVELAPVENKATPAESKATWAPCPDP